MLVRALNSLFIGSLILVCVVGSASGLMDELRYGRSLQLTGYSSQAALETISQVTQADNASPRYLLLLAKQQESNGDTAAALESYRRMSKRLPSNPNAWFGMARMKARMGQFDDSLVSNLRQARIFGPHERELNSQIGHFGLIHWYLLPPEARLEVADSIRFSLDHSYWLLLEKVRGYSQTDIICRRFLKEERFRQWCRNRGFE